MKVVLHFHEPKTQLSIKDASINENTIYELFVFLNSEPTAEPEQHLVNFLGPHSIYALLNVMRISWQMQFLVGN